MTKQIAIIVGTRPEVIKMAPVWFALRERGRVQPLLVSTGQHREMLDQALAAFDLKPDLDLCLMQTGQTLPDLTARVITNVSAALCTSRPAAVLVQGDTTTVLGAAWRRFISAYPMGM